MGHLGKASLLERGRSRKRFFRQCHFLSTARHPIWAASSLPLSWICTRTQRSQSCDWYELTTGSPAQSTQLPARDRPCPLGFAEASKRARCLGSSCGGPLAGTKAQPPERRLRPAEGGPAATASSESGLVVQPASFGFAPT